jgi:hypothetical protein
VVAARGHEQGAPGCTPPRRVTRLRDHVEAEHVDIERPDAVDVGGPGARWPIRTPGSIGFGAPGIGAMWPWVMLRRYRARSDDGDLERPDPSAPPAGAARRRPLDAGVIRAGTVVLPAPDAKVIRAGTVVLPAPDAGVIRAGTVVLPAPDAGVIRAATVVLPAPDAGVIRAGTVVLPAPDAKVNRAGTVVLPAPDAGARRGAARRDSSRWDEMPISNRRAMMHQERPGSRRAS